MSKRFTAKPPQAKTVSVTIANGISNGISNGINGATRGIAIAAIAGYQRFISPHKGFSCAHRVLYGCESCSQYFKNVIAEEGIFVAIANAKGRFQECREANEILKARRAKCSKSKSQRQKYYAQRDDRYQANLLINQQINQQKLAIAAMSDGESSDADDYEDVENTEDNASPEELNQPHDNSQGLGGSQWSRKKQQNSNNAANDSSANFDCGDCHNCADCAEAINAIPSECLSDRNCDNPLESMDCAGNCQDLNLPDLDCGNADCLSGMDCSGLDCGNVGDCGSVGDCASCGDCGSCG